MHRHPTVPFNQALLLLLLLIAAFAFVAIVAMHIAEVFLSPQVFDLLRSGGP